jgi:serine acetyltransferase
MTQFTFFIKDIRRSLGKHRLRVLFIWMTRSFIGVFLYRFERGMFLLFGRSYSVLRIFILPIILIFQAYSNIDIHYKANIKGGLLVLHPSVGCVISGQVIAGENLTLTGGNIIGVGKNKSGQFVLGDNITLGANATIIGPLELANNIFIGAGACVTKSFEASNISLIGLPAKAM